jgi:hypothetical protein
MSITVVFAPPLPSDNPATFNSKAFTLLGDLNKWSGQANQVAGDINADKTALLNAGLPTVSANIANVNTVATNVANVNAVGTNIARVNTVAGSIGNVNTVAANITDVTNYADTYLGPKASAPTTRNDGSALRAGDLYFNTTSGTLAVYHGSGWAGLNSAAVWGPTRTLTIGNTGKSVDGSANVSWSLVEILGFGTDMVDADHAAVLEALMQANTALRAINALRFGPWQQQGELLIRNRGVVQGCAVSKSTTAARNLNISAGRCFAGGNVFTVAQQDSAASVPPNTGSGAVTVSAYLYPHSAGDYRLAVTAIGQSVPDNGIEIYRLTIPAGSTDATDPYLANVTLTDVRRIEPDYPELLNSPPSVSLAFARPMRGTDWRMDVDVVSSTGAPCRADQVVITNRATNGCTLTLASAADDVRIRWQTTRLHD